MVIEKSRRRTYQSAEAGQCLKSEAKQKNNSKIVIFSILFHFSSLQPTQVQSHGRDEDRSAAVAQEDGDQCGGSLCWHCSLVFVRDARCDDGRQ